MKYIQYKIQTFRHDFNTASYKLLSGQFGFDPLPLYPISINEKSFQIEGIGIVTIPRYII